MNIENTTAETTGTDIGRPAHLGEKIAWWSITLIIFYLIFIDK